MGSDEVAIKVENLGKCYRLGVKEEAQDSLGAIVIDLLKSPIKNYRKYRSLYNFDDIDLEQTANILWALQDVSFEIGCGQKVGIIGGNGAGKSTLLKILSRITPPSSGSAKIQGRVSSLLEVGTGFHQELTGRDNVYLNGTILGMKKKEIDEKFDEIVAFSGVEKFLETPVKRYSSGMKVRLAFAVAAHLEPDILVVDEVLAVGDSAFQQKCLNKMEDVGKSGRTVLFVSHNMGAVVQLCERGLWLENGRLKLDGNVDVVASSYLNSGTQGHSIWNAKDKNLHKTNVLMLGARVIDQISKIPKAATEFDNPLELEIVYEVKRESRNAAILFRITDAQGNIIFLSRDTDTTDWSGRLRQKGTYISACKMPSFLKPGRYYVSIGAYEGRGLMDTYENVLTFDISSVGCTVNPERKGIIMPFLEWKVNLQSDKAKDPLFEAG